MDYVHYNILGMVVSGLLSFCVFRKHILLTLLSLEMLNLGAFLLASVYFSYQFSEYYFFLILVVFLVCDGVLGLSLLVSFIRVTGNDYVWGLGMLC